MVAFLKMIGKKIAVNFFSDPEQTTENIFKIIIILLFVIIIFVQIPIWLIHNLPSIIFKSSLDDKILDEQIKIITMYYDVPVMINEDNWEWVDEMKVEYSWCDDIVVEYDFFLGWQELMAIDSVKHEQDFSNVKLEDILDNGYMFVNKGVEIEKYEEEIEDEEGNITVVERTRAIIFVSTRDFDSVLNDLDFNEYNKKVVINIYENLFYIDIEGNLNIYDDTILSDIEYSEGTANLPYFNQTDKRWGGLSYGSSTIASGGCGPTALAMVISGLTGQRVTPDVVAQWSVANGHRAEGAGSYWSLMTEGGKHWGLSVEQVSRKNPQAIVNALSQGYPVIASMGRGHFTNGGHFIVLRGITDDGKILVYDPSSLKRSNQEWDLHIIMGESSTNGGVNGSPFWIFK